jgi:hypothetical protein
LLDVGAMPPSAITRQAGESVRRREARTSEILSPSTIFMCASKDSRLAGAGSPALAASASASELLASSICRSSVIALSKGLPSNSFKLCTANGSMGSVMYSTS